MTVVVQEGDDQKKVARKLRANCCSSGASFRRPFNSVLIGFPLTSVYSTNKIKRFISAISLHVIAARLF